MSIEWLFHIIAPLLIGFMAAVLNCVAKKHGFNMDCVYEGVGFIGGTMGLWFTALFQAPPGKVIVPMGSEAAAGAAKDAEIAAKKVTDAGTKPGSLDY